MRRQCRRRYGCRRRPRPHLDAEGCAVVATGISSTVRRGGCRGAPVLRRRLNACRSGLDRSRLRVGAPFPCRCSPGLPGWATSPIRGSGLRGSSPVNTVASPADGLHSTVRRLIFGDELQFLRYLGLHTAAIYADLPVIPGAINRAGVSPRCLACDKLVEHLSRQLRHAHATGLGDHPKLVACVL